MLVLSKKVFIKTVIVLLSCLLSISIISITNNPIVHIATIWMVCIIAILSLKIDFTHPYCWFSLFFSLYSSAYAILNSLGFETMGYDSLNLLLPIVFLSFIFLIITPKKNEVLNNNFDAQLKNLPIKFIIATCYILFLLILWSLFCVKWVVSVVSSVL
jgi:hypothetical protein